MNVSLKAVVDRNLVFYISASFSPFVRHLAFGRPQRKTLFLEFNIGAHMQWAGAISLGSLFSCRRERPFLNFEWEHSRKHSELPKCNQSPNPMKVAAGKGQVTQIGGAHKYQDAPNLLCRSIIPAILEARGRKLTS